VVSNHTMKSFLIAALMVISFSSCKKIKENIQEKQVLNFITDGQWKVAKLTQGSMDYTTDFLGYQFQFKTNESVDAIKNGAVQKTGTWHPDATNYTITSAFAADALHPLPLLNGTWKIIDGGNNFVVATKTENGTLNELRLEKP
jgi:hypothetical protein